MAAWIILKKSVLTSQTEGGKPNLYLDIDNQRFF